MAEEVKVCEKCPLSKSRTNAVPGEGPPDARVMIIGEGPGRNEDLQGRPFVGAAGKQLEGLLSEAGLERAEVFITNTVKCRPPENRRPADAECQACRPYLERQLKLIEPDLVVLLGDTALKRFLPGESLSKAHGRTVEKADLVLFPTYHPAAVIYNRSLEKTMRDDFRVLGRILRQGEGNG